jgi:beta-galactosidase
MMQRAGIKVIRIAEFSWSLSEPEEGKIDLSWIEEIIAFFLPYGIRIILCTPSATPPKWMVDKYPSLLQEDRYNHPRVFGSRRHYCFNSEIYREKCRIIVEKLGEQFGSNPNVEAWQIDNEFGCQDTAYCYCEDCAKAFRVWLQEKYKTIDNLNKTWGTVFWSQIYRSFDEILLPKASTCETSCPDTKGQNPSLFLDYKRFSSDSVISFQKLQLDILRKYTKAPVTTNFMSYYSELDYFKLAADLDFVSWDNYPDTQWGRGYAKDTSMHHALMRSLKKQPMWVMEQQSGPCGWSRMGANPEPGKLRLWTYQSIANGADTVVYFRWRACLFGTEQYWHGILNHDGLENRRFREICETAAELDKLASVLPNLEVKPKVAIIKFYDTQWSHSIHPHAAGFNYDGMISSVHETLYNRGISVDFVTPYEDLSSYKLVFAPGLNLVEDAILNNLESYVNNGGHLVLTYRSGTRNMNNTMYELPIPGVFAELAGTVALDFDPQAGRSVGVSGIFGNGEAKIWADVLEEQNAKVIARYTGHHYAGKPAVTENDYGNGKVYYLGCDLSEGALQSLSDYICDKADICTEFKYPIHNVEIVENYCSGKQVFFILNHNDHFVIMSLDKTYTNLLSGEEVKDVLTLQPYDVAILIIAEL